MPPTVDPKATPAQRRVANSNNTERGRDNRRTTLVSETLANLREGASRRFARGHDDLDTALAMFGRRAKRR